VADAPPRHCRLYTRPRSSCSVAATLPAEAFRNDSGRGAGDAARTEGRSARLIEGIDMPFDRIQLDRRTFFQLVAGAAAVPVFAHSAQADAYPSRAVRILVGFAPGSTTDILARLFVPWLTARLGQTFIVENRPGAGANIATEAVVKSAPDGYTLLMVAPVAATNGWLYPHLSYEFLRDLAPVAGVVRVPNVLEVNPALPVKTVSELIAYAKANPGKLSYASAGVGTASHLAGEMFNVMSGVHLQHVPYHGDGPAMIDLMGGQVQVGFATMTASIGHIRAGKLRPLAVTTTKRSDALPDVPCVSDFIPGYEASSWFGMAAPKDTPADIVGRLNREVNAGLADATIKARLADMGGMLLTGSPDDYRKLIAAETEKWGKVIRTAGITAE
jgi:tripartite-type tricarboxylate transporter receptor subunit TctC